MHQPGRVFVEQLIGRIRINATSEELHDGCFYWTKTRRRTARPVLALANTFFRLSGAKVHALADVASWQAWEVESFARLHGDRFRCFARQPATIAVEKLPGINLTAMLDHGTITSKMVAAVARELRRAHQLQCEKYAGPWSHGDPHIGNFVYDLAEDRARLIDFEVMHDSRMSAADRHANDVQVVLLDMLGRTTADCWQQCAAAFVRGYDCAEIAGIAVRQLDPPRGRALLWWAIRTSWIATGEAVRRIAELRAQL